jgi:hypothetical protein
MPHDLATFLLFVTFSGCFYLGGWLCYIGAKRVLRGEIYRSGAVLILLGLGLFFLCRLSFMGFYHQVN